MNCKINNKLKRIYNFSNNNYKQLENIVNKNNLVSKYLNKNMLEHIFILYLLD